VLRRISSPRTKLLAAGCDCLHLIKINCLALWLDESAHACTRSELRGASCEDWKSAFRQVKKVVRTQGRIQLGAIPPPPPRGKTIFTIFRMSLLIILRIFGTFFGISALLPIWWKNPASTALGTLRLNGLKFASKHSPQTSYIWTILVKNMRQVTWNVTQYMFLYTKYFLNTLL
jgi:hypothetical protein